MSWGVLLALVLTACGSGGDDVPPTRRPTDVPPTTTPRAEPLPDVAGAPWLGAAERPVHVLFAASDASVNSTARAAARDLQEHLEQDLGLTVNVEFVTETEALTALCTGQPVAAWINAFTYLQAQTTCAPQPALAIQRGTVPRRTLGQSADIVGRIDVDDIGDLEQRVFCRSAEQDEFTRWIYPGLIMVEAGLDPQTDLSAVYDLPDDLTVLEAIYRGDCAAAALETDTFDDLADDLAAQLSTDDEPLTSAAVTSVIQVVLPAGDVVFPTTLATWDGFPPHTVPYELLALAPAIPADLNANLVASLEAFFADRTDGDQRLTDLLDASGVFAVSAEDYAAFANSLAAVNWRLAYLP